jgi:hypothetical protein
MDPDPGAIVDELVADLRAMRGNRYADPAAGPLGDALRAVCEITEADTPADVRRKVGDRLTELAAGLPAELRLAVEGAFALVPDARKQFYQDRLRWAAGPIERNERTVRRRVDEAIRWIAQAGAARLAGRGDSDGAPPDDMPWRTARMSTVLNLSGPVPEAFEFRTIVADRDDLREIDLGVTLTDAPAAATLTMEVLYGGTLVRRFMEAARRFGMALALPRSLGRGDEHEFALRFTVPDGKPMRPHFVVVPREPCGDLTVRVKFDEKRLPVGVWRLTKVFQNELDDPLHQNEPVRLDAAHEISVEFTRLAPGFAYGVQWSIPPGPGE